MRITRKLGLAAILAVAGVASGARAQAAKVVIPAGSVLHVRLRTTLTSKTSKTGDKFDGVVVQPVMANGQEVVPQGSIVNGHVAFLKHSGRFHGRAEMRIVLDSITTPDDAKYSMAGTLEDAGGNPCAKTGSDDEGTVQGCGKSKKDAAKDAGLAAAMGAGAGATVGMGSEIDCHYFGNCGGPGIGTSTLYGAGLGAATALIYHFFKHEKQLILLGGTELTFIVNRSVDTSQPASETGSGDSKNQPPDKN
jgi:hypothetical protein